MNMSPGAQIARSRGGRPRTNRTRTWSLGLLVAGALAYGAIGDAAAALEPTEPRDCSQSLQSIVDAAAAGTSVGVPPCVFRETVTIRKPLTLVGQPGAEIRGSDVWTNWAGRGDGWISQQVLPPMPMVTDDVHACEPDTDNRCYWPQQVFLDGSPLELVRGNGAVLAGQFGLDPAGHVILADDPGGHLVEVTTRSRWLVTAADGVSIAGLTMRHASNNAFVGGVSNDGYSNWTLQDSTLADAHSAVVTMNSGSNVRVLRNDVSHAGLVGVAGSAIDAGGLVQGNHIHDNRTANASFNRDWGAGGLKLTLVQDFVVDGNEADHNDAMGLWCDIGCTNVTFSNNRVHHNRWQGINFEISNGASIHDNVTWENGWGKPFWGWGAGIVISSSSNAEVFGNTAAWNYAGISVIWQDRPDSPLRPVGNYVHDNLIVKKAAIRGSSETYWSNLSMAWLSDTPSALYEPTSNNRGVNNAVWYDQPEGDTVRFVWNTQFHTLAEFTDSSGGQGTRYLTAAAKEQVLEANNLPLNAEN